MNPNIQDSAALVGRVLLAVMFILSGFGKIGGFEGTAGYVASKGLPLPQVAVALTIALELGGGILLAIGWKARWVALAFAAFCVLAGIFFHNFWAVDDAQKMGEQINFMKNLSVAGGMLMVFAFGPGRYSVSKS